MRIILAEVVEIKLVIGRKAGDCSKASVSYKHYPLMLYNSNCRNRGTYKGSNCEGKQVTVLTQVCDPDEQVSYLPHF